MWLLLVLFLAAFGAGQVFGAAAELFGRFSITAPDVEVDISAIRSGAWQGLLALGLTAAAATLGGIVGAHDEVRRRWAYWG